MFLTINLAIYCPWGKQCDFRDIYQTRHKVFSMGLNIYRRFYWESQEITKGKHSQTCTFHMHLSLSYPWITFIHCSLILASYNQLTGKKSDMGFFFLCCAKNLTQHWWVGPACCLHLLYVTIKLMHKLPFP